MQSVGCQGGSVPICRNPNLTLTLISANQVSANREDTVKGGRSNRRPEGMRVELYGERCILPTAGAKSKKWQF